MFMSAPLSFWDDLLYYIGDELMIGQGRADEKRHTDNAVRLSKCLWSFKLSYKLVDQPLLLWIERGPALEKLVLFVSKLDEVSVREEL